MEKRFHITISYKESSFVNSSFIRGLNYVVLAIYGMGMISSLLGGRSEIYVRPTPFTLEIIIAACFSVAMIKRVINDTEFFEWDYTERCKKSRFTLKYSMLNFIFTSLCVHEIAFVVCNYSMIIKSKYLIIIEAIFLMWYLFNMINIISLYFALFAKELIPAYKIQERPKNWMDKGTELPEEEPLLERLNREFGI